MDLLDIENIMISIIAISSVILGISQIVMSRFHCIPKLYVNRGALELTKTTMCKHQVQNSDYHP